MQQIVSNTSGVEMEMEHVLERSLANRMPQADSHTTKGSVNSPGNTNDDSNECPTRGPHPDRERRCNADVGSTTCGRAH